LLLLADANLEVQHLGLLKRLVIVASDGIGQILIDIGVLWKDRHQGEAIVARRAKGAEPLYIRNGHNPRILAEASWFRLNSGRGSRAGRGECRGGHA